MGKIIRNGIEYCGTSDTADNIIYDNTDSGLAATNTQTAIDELSEKVKSGGNIVYLTQAEYEALPDSKLTDDVEYRITDANTAAKIAATDVTYGDSTVEEVIDEVQESVSTLNESLSEVFIRVVYTAEGTRRSVSAGDVVLFDLPLASNTSENIKNNISNYSPIGVYRISVASGNYTQVTDYYYDATTKSYKVWLANLGSSAENVYPYLYATLCRNDCVLV